MDSAGICSSTVWSFGFRVVLRVWSVRRVYENSFSQGFGFALKDSFRGHHGVTGKALGFERLGFEGAIHIGLEGFRV